MKPDVPPSSLYVHVPFCVRKCAYCDFYSEEQPERDLVAAYLGALSEEARRAAASGAMQTVYIGGGTPTALQADLLAQLFAVLRRHFDLSAVEEFTVEANPGTIDEEHVIAMLWAGVNRISLGVQSLNPATLRTLGRMHGPEEVHDAVGLLRRENLGDNLSLDLIFAVPGQTLHEWRDDITAAIDLDPDHLSTYGLSIPSETPMARLVQGGRLAPASDDVYVAMLHGARDLLRHTDFEHYEISNYALPGRRCLHNTAYWRNQPYIGLGPAAASYVGGTRWTNVADVAEYVRRLRTGASPVATSETLSPERRARETAMLNLRTSDGIIVADFREETGFDPLAIFAEVVERHTAAGLLEIGPDEGGFIRLTPAALAVADTVLADFVA